MKLSTTAYPTSDWCGVYPKVAGDPSISGVIDVMVEKLDGRVLLVAEVKGEVERKEENFQLLSELRALQMCQKKQPVFGLVVHPRNIRAYVPLKKAASTCNYKVYTFTITEFPDVLRALDFIFTCIINHGPAAAAVVEAPQPEQVEPRPVEEQPAGSLNLEALAASIQNIDSRLGALVEVLIPNQAKTVVVMDSHRL